jgi:hypothetical protein
MFTLPSLHAALGRPDRAAAGGGFQGYIPAALGNLDFIGIFAFSPEVAQGVKTVEAFDHLKVA